MTGSHPTDAGEMLGLVAELRSGLDEAAELINGIVDGIDSVLATLPDGQGDGIRDAVTGFRRMFDDTVTELGRALDRAGDPVALRATGAVWAVDIGGGVSGLAGLATENTTRADNHWTGDAAEAYLDTLLPQRLAITAVTTTGDRIDAVLNELANAIIDFWKNVEAAVITLLAGLVAAGAVATGGLTVVVAVGMAAAALNLFSASVVSQISMFTELGNAISIRTRELVAVRADDTAFPGGRWPSAVATDLNDGSITDGDDTDWHVE
ncbi:hypothetical protein [Pseudonocardia adelaidensis]|uniref:Uncharacterized protein n=1 Tax=Pseudonocardia adelaidensis TaxID=648754 RepID=A0ABP9N4V1_9PSEU